MNRLGLADRARILGCLTEGMSLRATTRVCEVSINTVSKLLVDVGTACDLYQNEMLRNLPSRRVQVDEIWTFCGMKEKNVPNEHKGDLGYGDVYTWVAIDADTKLVPCWLVGKRDKDAAQAFIKDLAERVSDRIQLTSDGFHAYVEAVQVAFPKDSVDYAMLVKQYSGSASQFPDARYSPGECVGALKTQVRGAPDAAHISTSYVERQNLTMRMQMRRATRLTNAFSRKIENHMCAVALHYMFYNFARIHKTLRVTPAMQAGISEHLWTLEEIARLAD